jgi:N-acyl-D-amino-acid deacylase
MGRYTRLSCRWTAFGVVTVALATGAIAETSTDLPISGAPVAALSDFDREFSALLTRYDVPGATVAIMQGDEIVFSRGYGWANVEEKVPAEPGSLFRIADVSTVFTAAAALKLVEDEQLSLDQRAYTVLNDLRGRKGHERDLGLGYITIENVLQMTAGWNDEENRSGGFDPMFGKWPRIMAEALGERTPASCKVTARYKINRPMQYKPGTSFSYSDFEYCLLGLIVNKANDDEYGPETYEAYVRKKILAPAGITGMRLGRTLWEDRAEGEVRYYPTPGENVGETLFRDLGTLPREYGGWFALEAHFGNGGWLATAEDLVTFAQAMAHGKVLSQESVDRMLAKPAVDHWEAKDFWFGMGWYVRRTASGLAWAQEGRMPGTVALLQRGPGDYSYAVLFNRDPGAPGFMKEYRALVDSAASTLTGN